MKKFNKYLLKLSFLVGLNAFGSANAGFQSLHQFPVVYNISSALDAGGNIYYNKTNQLFGFKEQFAPAGITGCLIGYPELRDKCQTVNGGFGFSFDGYTSHQEFKVYVPTGTTFFGVSGYMPQSVQYGVAVKLGAPPARATPLTEAEYQAAKSAQNRFQDFGKLLAGEERIIVHDGGGAISLSGIARLKTPLATGQWLYFRVLTANTSVAGLGAIYEVNRDQYRGSYNALTFGADGDPVDGGGTTPTVPPLEGITLSPNAWNAATDEANPTIKVTPKPEGARLPDCTVSPANLLTTGAASATEALFDVIPTAVTNPNTKVTVKCGDKEEVLTLQPKESPLTRITLSRNTDGTETIIKVTPHPAGAKLPTAPACTGSQNLGLKNVSDTAAEFKVLSKIPVTTNTTVTVDCGVDKKASLILYPNVGQIKDKISTTDADGNFVLNFKLTRPSTTGSTNEVVSTNKTNFWVAAHVPSDGFPFSPPDGSWFFFKPSGWMLPMSPNLLLVAYEENKTPVTEKIFTIPTGLPESVLQDFEVKLYLGYEDVNSNNFKNMGVIWGGIQ